MAGLTIHFISLDHLKRNTRAVGRLQRLADLEGLAWLGLLRKPGFVEFTGPPALLGFGLEGPRQLLIF